jgi:hypothetical protein
MAGAFILSWSIPLTTELESSNVVWPEKFSYTHRWPSRAKAKQALGIARVVFMVVLTKTTYAAYYCPPNWVEDLVTRGLLSVSKANNISASLICQSTDLSANAVIERVGLIVDV